MKKSLILSILVIALVIALTAGATWAYFSSTINRTTTITTAKIAIGSTTGFPLSFSNLLPAEPQSLDVTIQNTGNREADFYVQLISDGSGLDFCNPSDVLDVRIEDLDVGGDWYSGSICNLFPGWDGSTIAKIGENVSAGTTKNYRIHLTLDPLAGNAYQDASNSDIVHLIAVQYNGPAPIPDDDGGTAMPQAQWPDDTHGNDDDPNYGP